MFVNSCFVPSTTGHSEGFQWSKTFSSLIFCLGLKEATLKSGAWGFPGGSLIKNPANAGDAGSIPDLGRFTCHGATKPMHHNCCACALEPRSHNCWSLRARSYWSQLLKPACLQLLKPACPQLLEPACPQLLKPAYPQLLKPACPQLLKPTCLEATTMMSLHTASRERPTQEWRPSKAKNNR